MSDTKPQQNRDNIDDIVTDITTRTNELVTDMLREHRVETTDYILENWAYLKDVLKEDTLFPEEIRTKLMLERSQLFKAVRKANG